NKLQALKPKLAEGSHYKSIIHRLRKRWYLRPFIPASLFEPPAKSSPLDRATAPMAPTAFSCWHFRGPRFDPPGSDNRGRVLIAAHELGDTLFGAENSLIDLV